MTAALDGVLVADFSRVLAGPLATMTLADLGATVVKVERPGTGDDTRSWGPPWTDSSSSYFDSVNRGKYGVTLDLGEAADRAAARELVRRADVVVQNFRPGGLRQYGLDYESVAKVNRSVVYCSISGFGAGAGAERPGYDFLLQALGGLMSITGQTDGEPTKVGVALVDVLTGKDAVIGILASLNRRAATGLGEHVEVNLLSSLLGGLVNQAEGYLATGTPPTRMGNRHPSIAPYETLRCADGPLAVACGNDGQFRRLAGAIGAGPLADDPRFATNSARVSHRDELVDELEQRLLTERASVWETRLTAVGVPAGQVEDIGAAIARAVELGLDPLLEFADGRRPQIRHPATYASGGTASPIGPPKLGEHDSLVRAWLSDAAGSTLPGTTPRDPSIDER